MSDQVERIFISGPVGQLETLIEKSEYPARGVAILCHPHPLHGGTLTNKVVHALADSLREMSLISVRFNFRGVGKSDGVYADGIGEQDDLRAVISWVKERYGLPVWLGGFSFGGAVALAVVDERVDQLITVAPAVNIVEVKSIRQPVCPWLLIQGEADELVPADMVRAWLEENGLEPVAEFLPGIEHFFHGKLNVLKQTLLRNLSGA